MIRKGSNEVAIIRNERYNSLFHWTSTMTSVRVQRVLGEFICWRCQIKELLMSLRWRGKKCHDEFVMVCFITFLSQEDIYCLHSDVLYTFLLLNSSFWCWKRGKSSSSRACFSISVQLENAFKDINLVKTVSKLTSILSPPEQHQRCVNITKFV